MHVRDGAGHLTLAGTLDEYGDIRSVRPRQEESQLILERENMPTSTSNRNNHQALGGDSRHTATASIDAVPLSESHELEVEMLQWPFIDESWSLGFDTGFDTAWPSLGVGS
jgi:hypothetical protein